MIDPGTGLTILGSAIGGAKVVEKILGPTADYIGNQIKEWAEKRIHNTAKIFQNAEKKLGTKINEPGEVPPKVLKGILEDGAWSEEELQIEYFGGVLASSRSGISRDDRGAYFTGLISRLTTYQLRAHFLFYQAVKINFDGQQMNAGSSEDRSKMQLFIPLKTYIEAMDFTEEEIKNIQNIIPHSLFGLYKEDLIDPNFHYGPVEYIAKFYKDVPEPGIIFSPTRLGVELMMWAYGFGQKSIADFFKTETTFSNEQNIKLGKSIVTKQPRPK